MLSAKFKVNTMTRKEELENIIKDMYILMSHKDCEIAHIKADKLLCKYLETINHKEIVEAYKKVCKWYS
jgi:hypothetical protein